MRIMPDKVSHELGILTNLRSSTIPNVAKTTPTLLLFQEKHVSVKGRKEWAFNTNKLPRDLRSKLSNSVAGRV